VTWTPDAVTKLIEQIFAGLALLLFLYLMFKES